MTITVLIADDQALVRAGFTLIVNSQPDLRVVAEAADGRQAITLARRNAPDVVLMDIRMPGMDGIEATRVITGADTGGGSGGSGDRDNAGDGAGDGHTSRVIILTTYDLDEYVFDALAAGASGFVLKDVRPEQLVEGIRVVAAGDALLAPALTRRLITEFARQQRRHPRRAPRAGGPADTLTAREVEVLGLIARGRSNAEIATTLHLSENTIKTHVTHLLDKLALRDRVHAVIYAYENGLVEPGL